MNDVERVELTGKYQGYWVEIDSDPELRVYRELASGNFDRIIGAMAILVVASNVRRKEEPVDLTTSDGWMSMPKTLLTQVSAKVMEVLREDAPKSELEWLYDTILSGSGSVPRDYNEMTFCREFHCLPEAGGYFDQSARLMNRWSQYLVVEREAGEMRQKIEAAKAKQRR